MTVASSRRDLRAARARELPLLFALDRVDPRRVASCLAAEPEHAHLAALIERVPARLDGWMRGYVDLAFAQSLFASAEFRYVR